MKAEHDRVTKAPEQTSLQIDQATQRALRAEQKATRLSEELADLREQHEAQVGRMQEEIDALRSERETLAALSRQQAKELIVARRRLEELLASRWRRLGQAIGVAMVLPWEKELANRNGRSGKAQDRPSPATPDDRGSAGDGA